MKKQHVESVRQASRRLIRELGILDLDKTLANLTPQLCHSIIEIGNAPGITVSGLAEILLLSVSAASRLVNSLLERELVEYGEGVDKRTKMLSLTDLGQAQLTNIDQFSNKKVQGAFEFLTEEEQKEILSAIQKYASALEKSRKAESRVKILTLSTSRMLRRQIVAFIEAIQRDDLQVEVTEVLNSCILRAEEEFSYSSSCNFWYAVDEKDQIIGTIGLKRIDAKNAELKKLFVDKQFRGRKVAQSLLETLLKAALRHGFKTIWLGTTKQAKQAHSFYTKCGFEPVDANKLPKGFERCPLDCHFFRASVAAQALPR